MTASSPTSRHNPPRPPTAGRHAWWTLVNTVQFAGRVLRGLLATVALLALVAGLPWALTHYIGWPLPDHIPTWDEVEATLLNPMSAQFLLDTLACLCWIVWFFFTVDVALCAIDAARGITWPDFRPSGPLRGLAAALVGTIVLTILGNRTPTTPPATATVLTSDLTPAAVTAPLHPGPAQPATTAQQQSTTTLDWSAPAPPGTVKATEEVRLPHREGGTVVYDSLWRVAERMFGDGNRWPELYKLNCGVVQADGRALTQPHLVRPGWKITGYVPAPAPPAVQPPPDPQQPPAPPSQPPKTTTPTPPTTTQPAPGTSQAPATDTAAPTGEQETDRQPGLDLLTGAFVSLLLAGVISAAAVSVRMWRRRHYRIGSGDRSDLHQPIAPVVRALRTAHDGNDGDDGLDDLDDVEVIEATAPAPVRIHITEAGAIEPDNEPVAVPARVGVRGGRELALNLASTRGLGLLGPGASAAARAILLHLLAQHIRDGQRIRVLLPASDLPLIFDGANAARLPSTVCVVDSLDAALDEMEAELVTRTRHLTDETTPRPSAATLVLLGSPAPHAERRLQGVLDNGSTLGMAGILLSQWRPGATVRVRSDGTIGATSPGPGDSLAGARLFTLPATDATELFTVLCEAEGPVDLEPQDPGRGRVDPDDEGDERPVDDAEADHANGQPPRSEQNHVDEPGQLESTLPPDTRDDDQHIQRSAVQRLDIQPAPALGRPGSTAAAPVTDADHREPAAQVTSAEFATTSASAPQSARPAADEQADERVPQRPLALRVLGRVELVLHVDGEERELGGALTPKQREVLVYLALHPHGARREALNDAVWPDARPPRPFNSLHNALSLLRRALTKATDGTITNLVRNDDGRYQLDDELVTTDIARFHTALQAPRAGSGNDALVPLHEAIQLYRGDLAEDLSAAWIEPVRESLRRDALDALSALIRLHGDTEPETALVLLERARKLDPYNESIYRDIIRTQARLGQYDAIPRTLALLGSTLDDIGQQPSSDTLNLAEFLQRRGTRPSAAGNAAAS